MLYYWIKFEKDPEPRNFTFKNHSDLMYSLDRLILERGNIEWMIKR